MFKDDALACRNYALESEENIFKLGVFVSLSIRRQTHLLRRAVYDTLVLGKDNWLGIDFISQGYDDWHFNSSKIYDLLKECDPSERQDVRVFQKYLFDNVRGIGLVKSGFMTQLCLNASGCIDVHNMSLYPEAVLKLPSVSKSMMDKTKLKHVDTYLDIIDECGGSESLWDRWCEHVAKEYPHRFKNGESVSSVHRIWEYI